ncbi:MAG: hypothetical protein AAFX57_18795 [Bacteroidota bacterium]
MHTKKREGGVAREIKVQSSQKGGYKKVSKAHGFKGVSRLDRFLIGAIFMAIRAKVSLSRCCPK